MLKNSGANSGRKEKFIDGTNCQGDVVIPDTVTSIGDYAFVNSELTSVTISDSVKNIKMGAFRYCSELKSVVLSESVDSIATDAFSPCKSLASITFKNPECKIFGLQECISNDYKGNFDGTIYGYEGSTAQAYAEKYNRKFESLGSAPETSETQEFTPGDADGDGKVDIMDVISINKAILGKEKLTDEQLKAIDFNHNGKPDAEDSLILMKYIAGLITSLS